MALTQSARLPGPSWDEEVVPALRQRLESESRTLARRMSAISISSVDNSVNSHLSSLPESSAGQRSQSSDTYVDPGGSHSHSALHHGDPRPSYDRKLAASSPRANGAVTPSKTESQPSSFQRSRTYSQPFASDLPNGKSTPRPRTNGSAKTATDVRPFSPRPTDVKPTRIPRPTGITPVHSQSNGNAHHSTFRASPEPYPTPDPQTAQDAISLNSSRSNIVLPPGRQVSGLFNEPPPFNTGSVSSHHGSYFGSHMADEPSPRTSNESEERPFEHWYRGEVSRNGGVGELRVGRRQEMLEIANYGHSIRKNAARSRKTAFDMTDDFQHRRKRADSTSGIDSKILDRGSLYLDEAQARSISRVLDESPLTDLEGEDETDVDSRSERASSQWQRQRSNTIDSHVKSPSMPLIQAMDQARSMTPTPTPSTSQRASSQISRPSSRIPSPTPRKSSDSRAATPSKLHRGSSEPAPLHASTSTTTSARQRKPSRPSPSPARVRKGSNSPASATPSSKSRTAASKATRAKTEALRKEMAEEANRRSVATYPTPEGEDMADAIPVWTQPVPKTGNWDEVVLPVVARKKGLDDHYQQADGSVQPKKVGTVVAPAPGTFGFDHTKYRPTRDHTESIPMDEFGRKETSEQPQSDPGESDPGQPPTLPAAPPNAHEATRLPYRPSPPPSPAPFSHYAPSGQKTMEGLPLDGVPPPLTPPQKPLEPDDGGAGCCKCVIM